MDKRNILVILFLDLTFRSCKSEFTPIIKTNSGSLRGQTYRILDKTIFEYLGVPYATPPVGDMRFGKPLAIGQWEGVYQATEQPLPCIQKIKYSPYPWKTNQSESSEDCLYLNIWTPELTDIQSTPSELKPVLVWIYGGSFTHGSIDIDMYSGSVLCAYGDVVVASMNYRVGLFGFLNANTESCPGNVGLHDQLVAMKWIKENIEFFGGDPNQITLFGESAGAMSIGGHLVSPLSRGLFTRAILQSGSLYGPIVKGRDSLSGRSKVREISKRVGCFNDEEVDIENMINCLKIVPAEELLEVAEQKRGDFGPMFGDDYIPIDPNEAFKTGSFQNVELLIGANMDEGSHFFPSMFPQIFNRHNDETVDITKESAALYMKIIFQSFPEVESEVVARFYLQNISVDDHVSIRKALYDSFGDYLFLCPAVHVAEHVARYQGNVYFYFFTHRPSNSVNGKWMGVTHFEEVQFVFGVPLRRRYEYTEDEQRLSTRIMDVWLTFARRGKPPSIGNVPWLSYSIKDHYYVDLNDQQFTVRKGPHEKGCIFWRNTL